MHELTIADRQQPGIASETTYAEARRGSERGRFSWRRLVFAGYECSSEESGEQRQTRMLLE